MRIDMVTKLSEKELQNRETIAKAIAALKDRTYKTLMKRQKQLRHLFGLYIDTSMVGCLSKNLVHHNNFYRRTNNKRLSAGFYVQHRWDILSLIHFYAN